LPYARFAISPQFSQPCRRSRKLTGETKPSSAARPHAVSGSRRAIRPALHLSCTTLPRPPQARLATMTTTRSPLKDEPGWATHTTNPNFGNGEYFRGEGLAGVLPDGIPATQWCAPQADAAGRPVAPTSASEGTGSKVLCRRRIPIGTAPAAPAQFTWAPEYFTIGVHFFTSLAIKALKASGVEPWTMKPCAAK
jgi:hypothetical protein